MKDHLYVLCPLYHAHCTQRTRHTNFTGPVAHEGVCNMMCISLSTYDLPMGLMLVHG